VTSTPRTRRGWGLDTKLTLAFAGLIILVALPLGGLLYAELVNAEQAGLRARLGDLLSFSILQIDGDFHARIQNAPDLRGAFGQNLRLQLAQIQASSPLIRSACTIRPQQGRLGYVLCAPQDIQRRYGAAVIHPELNIPTAAPLTRQPQIAAAIRPDANGAATLSGYAPFYDSLGNLQGYLLLEVDAAEMLARQAEARRTATVAVGVTLPAALLLAFLLVGHLSRPLHDLMAATERLAQGDLSTVAPVRSRDEIGLLAETFNAMTGQLSASMAEVRLSEERLRTLINGTPDIVCFKDGQGRWLEANNSHLALFQLNEVDYRGHSDAELAEFSPFYRDTFLRCEATDERAWTVGGLTRGDETIRLPGGETKVYDMIKAPVFAPDGSRRGLVVLGRDITARRRAETDLQRLNDELEARVAERTARLEAANRELESFSYSVSHDLRAPLRGIDGFSQALLEDYGPSLDPQASEYLERVRASAQRMGELINSLLRLSRITRSEIHCTLVDLSALFSAQAAELSAQDAPRSVDWRIQPDLQVEADADLLRIVVENLLSNAWKFTRRQDEAIITIGQEAGAFFVRDNGVGFDPAYAQKLFGAFQRLHTAAEFEGVGVGLATVQRIIHRHGGRIWAVSELGRGATFYFTLGENGVDVV
jgi:PAS domain S-box-containing protein